MLEECFFIINRQKYVEDKLYEDVDIMNQHLADRCTSENRTRNAMAKMAFS